MEELLPRQQLLLSEFLKMSFCNRGDHWNDGMQRWNHNHQRHPESWMIDLLEYPYSV